MRKIAAILAVTLLTSPALACPAAQFTPEQMQPIPEKPDQALFSSAVLAATNHARCKVGKRLLRDQITLRKTAILHSRNMARTNTFGHVTRVGGAQTLRDRATKTRLRWRQIAENIARLPRYQFQPEVEFNVVDRASCIFQDPVSKELIPSHSYASLAQQVVSRWMSSKGHRKNIESRSYGRMSAAAVFRPNQTCGDFYITQVFAD